MCHKDKRSSLKLKVYWHTGPTERLVDTVDFQMKKEPFFLRNNCTAVLIDEKTMVHCGRCSPTWK